MTATRLFATTLALLLGCTPLVVLPAGASRVNGLSWTARPSTYRPLSFHIVTIYVTTKPKAAVSGVVDDGKSSWSMVPTAPANVSGKARLYQKISAVLVSRVNHVTVNVSLNGLVGDCDTQFKPMVYTARS